MGMNGNGLMLLEANVSKAIEKLEMGMQEDYPMSYHLFGEVIHYGMVEIP